MRAQLRGAHLGSTVTTSPTGGAAQLCRLPYAPIKRRNPRTAVEALTTGFPGSAGRIVETVVDSGIEVFRRRNIETVRRLNAIRCAIRAPATSRPLQVLEIAKQRRARRF